MVKIGEYNKLEVVKQVDFGFYLQGFNYGEILLPMKYAAAGTKPGDILEVFIYTDSEDRIIATTIKPHVSVGTFAYLHCKDVTEKGAFFDWGLEKDLFVPFAEQAQKVIANGWYTVHAMLDTRTDRVIGSTKVEKYFEKNANGLSANAMVDLLVYKKTELGYKCIVDNRFAGLLHHSDVFANLKEGMRGPGYIKGIQTDGKINLSMQSAGYGRINDVSNMILARLESANEFLPLHDKSTADEIYQQMGISKKTFKQAIGKLYKEQLISILENGIRLNPKQPKHK